MNIPRILGVNIFFFLFLLSSAEVNSQGCTKNCVARFNDFSGGLATRPSAFSISSSQADTVENIRLSNEHGSISKRDPLITACSAHATEPITGLHRLYLSDGTKVTIANYADKIVTCDDTTGLPTTILTVTTGDKRWDWLTWHNLAIGTDGTNQPVKYDGTSASATYLGTALAVDAGSGAGPNGTYTYKVTCYSSSYEASMDVASNSVTVSDNDITLTMIPICPDEFLGESITGRKIYRIEDGGSTYKLLSNGTIADNTTVTLTDSDADGDLGAALSPTHTRTIPKGRFAVVHRDRLWLANNASNPSRLFYSASGGHDFFDSPVTVEGGFFDVRPNDGDEITCAENLLGKLTICKTNTIQKFDADGDTPSADWAISDPFSFIGVQAPYSVKNSSIGLIYLANNGIYYFDGQYSRLLSDLVEPVIRDIQPSNFANVWATFFKNNYYMAYTSFATGASSNNRILVFNLIDKNYMIDKLNINVFHVFNAGTDVEALFSGGSDLGTIYAHTETSGEIIHKIHDDFAGTFDDMRYIPVAVGGDPEDPVLELAWTTTIDEASGTIDVGTGIIDRPDTNGTYISQFLTVNASAFDKLFWNETIPAEGGDVTFAIKAAAATGDLATTAWSGEFSNSAGSDISDVTPDTVMQYRISMSTDDITVTPNLIKQSNYVVRLTYDTTGTSAETTIPIRWRSGWLDFGMTGYTKELRSMFIYYDWPADTSGTLNVDFENFAGNTTGFDVDLDMYPRYYKEQFSGGKFSGEFIRFDITESSLNAIKIKEIILVYDVAPYQFRPANN